MSILCRSAAKLPGVHARLRELSDRPRPGWPQPVNRPVTDRRLGGQIVMVLGGLLALLVAIALIVIDFRLAAVAPRDQRDALLRSAIETSLMWACGAGSAVSLVGLLLFLSARRR